MRFDATATAITWLPFAALDRLPAMPLELAVAHYDEPPPEVVPDLDELRRRDAFREANELIGWIEVEGGRIVEYGHEGRGLIGVTRIKVGPKTIGFPAVEFPVIQPEPELGDGWVRFVQTAGGRMGLPAPRRVRGKPYFQIASASAWTTLQLIVYATGQAKGSLIGASPFPRHWLYDADGKLIKKSATVDFEQWYRESYGANTPWGSEDTPAFVTAVETELERDLSRSIMTAGGKMPRRRIEQGETLVEQGEAGDELFLLLDGVLEVEVDGEIVGEVGPGAVLGEYAALEGERTATLRAATPCRVVVLSAEQVSRYELEQLAASREQD